MDVVRWIPLFTLDVLGVTVLSRNFNAMKGEEDKDLKALNILLRETSVPKTLILGKVSSVYLYNLIIDSFIFVVRTNVGLESRSEGQQCNS